MHDGRVLTQQNAALVEQVGGRRRLSFEEETNRSQKQ